MNILLLNDNPVVNKLVTLSAQKTSDTLDVVNSIDAIVHNSYDLLVIDDTLYHNDIFTQIKQKISFKKSLYICSRDTEVVDTFDTVLKKPFLPTDLVELFSSISKEVATMSEFHEDEPLIMLEDDVIEDDYGEEINLDTETTHNILDDDEAQKVKELLDETSDEFEDLDDELDLSDIDLNLSVDNDTLLSDAEELEEDESGIGEELELDLEDSLELEDEDELQLEENFTLEEDESEIGEELELDLEDSLELEDEDAIAIEATSDLALEDDLNIEENAIEDEEELELETDLELEESLEETSEDDFAMEEAIEIEEDLDIEDQIKTAVSELSEEDLEEEVSEETLLEIAETEINSLDALTSRDLKLAIGEEVEDEPEDKQLEEEIENEDNSEAVAIEEDELQEQEDESSTDGVEALKNLLSALTDKNVAASMKGMKISINITLGDNS